MDSKQGLVRILLILAQHIINPQYLSRVAKKIGAAQTGPDAQTTARQEPAPTRITAARRLKSPPQANIVPIPAEIGASAKKLIWD